MNPYLSQPGRDHGRRRRHVLVCLMLGMALLMPGACLHAQQSSTNVQIANVTPSGFTVIWRGQPGLTSDIRLFADENGTVPLDGKLAVEPYPLHTGSPYSSNAYERRQSKTFLRSKTSDHGLRAVRVSGCEPSTRYHFQLISRSASSTNVSPVTGPFPFASTSARNSLVPDGAQILMDVQGLDVAGRIVTLSVSNTMTLLAGVVGDGGETNQVWFNLADLVELGGGANFTHTGSIRALAQVLGGGPDGGATLTIPVELADAFRVARTVATQARSEIVAIEIGSTVMRGGTTSSVPISVDSTIAMSRLSLDLTIPAGRLGNLTLIPVAPEVDPSRTTIQPLGSEGYRMTILPRPGELLLTSSELVRLQFTALTGVPSSFVSLFPSTAGATRADGTAARTPLRQPGRVVVVVNEPLLEAHHGVGARRNLTLYGKPLFTYGIETAPTLTGPWRFVREVAVSQLTTPLDVPGGTGALEFYRAFETETHPPRLQVSKGLSNSVDLVVFGRSGTNYTLQGTASLSPPVQWRNVSVVRLTNSFRTLTGIATTNPFTAYRITLP
ncbi:MAG: hypothetical protein FJ405_07550 [Verrucomicrobia bacterium]|nr:hypothetical protein [Verrucomicrobiota bacterium]